MTATLLVSVNCQCLSSNDQKIPRQDGQTSLYTGQQEFSLALLHEINHLNPEENIFFSPFSTYHALLLAYFISSNTTEQYLKKVLRFGPNQDKTDVFGAYRLAKFSSTLKRNSAYEFNNANRIYVDKNVDVRECMQSMFQDEFKSLDFSGNAEASRKEINKWVEEVTHDMIQGLLPPSSVDENTNLVLVNAAYFKGNWENKFKVEETAPEIFYINPSKKTFVDMMHTEGAFNHEISEDLGAHILELPYQGSNISMYILLPPFVKEDGVASILKKLTLERFRNIVGQHSSLQARTVEVSLPKFTLDHTIEMVPIFEKMGVGNLFNGGDFSALTSANISLGNALHKSRIEVNEEGAKAASATVLFTFRSSRPADPAVFNCNHPFVYIIYDKIEQALLFTGVFRRPY